MKAINLRVAVALEELRDAVLARAGSKHMHPELVRIARRGTGRLFVDDDALERAGRVDRTGDELQTAGLKMIEVAVIFHEASERPGSGAAKGRAGRCRSTRSRDACRVDEAGRAEAGKEEAPMRLRISLLLAMGACARPPPTNWRCHVDSERMALCQTSPGSGRRLIITSITETNRHMLSGRSTELVYGSGVNCATGTTTVTDHVIPAGGSLCAIGEVDVDGYIE